MPYGSDIDANLGNNHRWSFDGNVSDGNGTADGVASGIVFSSIGICKDVTNCAETNSTSDRITLPSRSGINDSSQERKAMGGWFMPTAIQNPPKNIYGEGNTSQGFRFILGWGNYIMFEIDTNVSIVQIFGDVSLDPNRAYHIFLSFEGNTYGNIVKAYLDGVPQINASPVNRQPQISVLPSRTVGEFGDPAGSVSVGGAEVLLIAPINGKYNEWCTWNGSDAIISEDNVRVELFEKGALGDVIISSGSQTSMQTALNSESNTIGNNAVCDIEVETVTGNGDLELTIDNRTFNPLASIHIKYLGTGTLRIINLNGSNAIQNKCSAPWGTIIIENPTDLVINFTQINSEIRIYDNNASGNSLGDNLDGIESSVSESFTFSHLGISNNIAIQIMKDGFQEILFFLTIGSNEQTLNFTQQVAINE
jgi:hypothetical protein